MTALLRVPKRLQGGKKVAHNHAPKQERLAAKTLGGKVVKGSGSGDERGDVRVKGVVRLECKCTAKKSFTLTRAMVEKIEAAALSAGEVPAMQIEFINDAGKVLHRVALVPTYVLDELVHHGPTE